MYIFQPVPALSYSRHLLQAARNDLPGFSFPQALD